MESYKLIKENFLCWNCHNLSCHTDDLTIHIYIKRRKQFRPFVIKAFQRQVWRRFFFPLLLDYGSLRASDTKLQTCLLCRMAGELDRKDTLGFMAPTLCLARCAQQRTSQTAKWGISNYVPSSHQSLCLNLHVFWNLRSATLDFYRTRESVGVQQWFHLSVREKPLWPRFKQLSGFSRTILALFQYLLWKNKRSFKKFVQFL